MYAYANGIGQNDITYNGQTTYYDSHFYRPGFTASDGAADSGLNLRIYSDSSLTSSTLYGVKGVPMAPDTTHPPDR